VSPLLWFGLLITRRLGPVLVAVAHYRRI
jgi:hypothetical protein